MPAAEKLPSRATASNAASAPVDGNNRRWVIDIGYS
jgi:hypothetical protein